MRHVNREPLADVAVIVQTILRPSLLRSVRSVFAQDFPGRIQLLIGVDTGDRTVPLLDILRAECPPHIMLTIMDLGYSTSRRHGGFYSNHYGGALRTILSYAANSRYVAYLDDNDWYARDHLAALCRAIAGRQWAFSYRWLADPETGWPICKDDWDSVGPGRGINKDRFGGFVQPSTLMLDKAACHHVLPLWSLAAFPDGGGEDRLIFDALIKGNFSWAASGAHSCFCLLNEDSIRHTHHTREFESRGIRWVTDRGLVTDAKRHMVAATARYRVGDLAGTGGACRQVLAINPHHADARHLLALVEWKLGRGPQALDHLTQAIAVEDGTDTYFASLALILLATGNSVGATETLAAARRRFPRSAVLEGVEGQLRQASP
jgi:hypothetical protein